MRNSKKRGWIAAVIFLAAFLAIDALLCYLLIPNTYARISIHYMETEKSQDVFVGTSRGACGIDPDKVDSITGRTSVNLCLGAAFPTDYLYLIKEARRTGSAKRVIYELDASYYVVPDYQGIQDPFIMNAMPFSSVKLEYYMDKNLGDDFRIGLFPWMFHRNGLASLKSSLEDKLSADYKNYTPPVDASGTYHSDGFLYYNRITEGWDKEQNYLEFNESEIRADRVQALIQMIQYCKANNIELITVTLPVPEDSLNTRSEDYQKADAYFRNIMDTYGVEYLNFEYLNTGFDNNLDGFRDYEGHMWGDTAEEFSSILGEYLKDN